MMTIMSVRLTATMPWTAATTNRSETTAKELTTQTERTRTTRTMMRNANDRNHKESSDLDRS